MLFAAAALLFIGYQFIVLAMRIGDIAYVVPIRYTSLLWAILLGFLAFGNVPDGMTLAGSLIVIATGLITVYRKVRLGRRTATVAPVVSNTVSARKANGGRKAPRR